MMSLQLAQPFVNPWALIEANNAKLAAVFIALKSSGKKAKGELSAIQEVERDYQCQVLSIIDLDDFNAIH